MKWLIYLKKRDSETALREENMKLVQQIEEAALQFTDTRRSIARVILEHRKDFHELSLKDIADLAYVSKATVVRFAQHFGYQGWMDFRDDYIAQLYSESSRPERVDVNYPFDKEADLQTISRNIGQTLIQGTEDTLEALDPGMVSRIVSLMERARRIVIFCVSPHTYSAQLFARKMLTIQKPVQVSNAREMGITARTLTNMDMAIIISYAGNNPDHEPMNVTPYLREARIPTAVITSRGDNYLRQNFTNVLTIPDEEHLYTKMATFYSEQSVICLLDILFAGYFARHFEKNDQNKIHTARQLEDLRRNSRLHE